MLRGEVRRYEDGHTFDNVGRYDTSTTPLVEPAAGDSLPSAFEACC